MRWPLLSVIAIAVMSNCNWPMGTTTGAGATGDSGAACPQVSGCAACTMCAQSGPCAALNSACISNSDCQAIDQCYGVCGSDATCRQGCQANSPNGVADYTALTTCVDCQECPTACGLCGQ